MSKKTFIKNAMNQHHANDNIGFICQDETYRILTCDFPVVIFGTIDKNHKFRLICQMITNKKNKDVFNYAH